MLRKHEYPFWLLLAALTMNGNTNAAPYRKTLISSDQGVRLNDWHLGADDLNLNTDERWSVRKTVLHGGKQEGVDLIVVDNGRLRFSVIPTRGMSVLEVGMGDVRLGWDSPVKEIVHPRHINLQSRDGLGWLEGFNEWMVRCGLEFAGHPGQDKFVNNVGDEATMNLTLHGKIGNIPASEVEVVIDDAPPYRIRIKGRVDERMFYGPQLELWTEISTTPGSSEFAIEDTVTNRGADDQEIQLIYHGNFGKPLLEAGAEFVAPIRAVAGMNAHAVDALADQSRYAPPTSGFIEEVFCIRPWAEANGDTTVMLKNSAGDRGVSLSYSTQVLPYLTQWKNTAPLKAGYVTGIEPGTCFPYNRRVERHFGRVPKLEPGETRAFQLNFGILANASEVDRVGARIKAIQAGRSTEIKPEPEVDLGQFE